VVFVFFNFIVPPHSESTNAKTSDAAENHMEYVFVSGMIGVVHNLGFLTDHVDSNVIVSRKTKENMKIELIIRSTLLKG
jgi:hypothetical protein